MPFPVATVRTPQLQPRGEYVQIWRTGGVLTSGRHGTVAWRHDDGLLFGSGVMEEAGLDATQHTGPNLGSPLHLATSRIYGDIFDSLDHAGFPHLLRMWNFIPDINGNTHGSERYQQFNSSRHERFAAYGRATTKGVPAASAVGVGSGTLAVCFIAGRVEPIPIENPRQVSAYNYPRRYGPRGPTFSRASVTRLDGQEILFVSGTASIVSHRSVHIGDVAAQTRESLANIAAVIDAANQLAADKRYDLACLHYKVYVRHAKDLSAIRKEVQRTVGANAAALYLQADICRHELLVEIEASGGHALTIY